MPDRGTEEGADPIEGTGVDVDSETARLKAIFECVERYSGAIRRFPHPHLRASFRELGDRAVDPTAFALFSAEQCRRPGGLRQLTAAEVLDWCWGFSLTRHRPRLVPSVLAHVRGDLVPDDVLPELTSTGMASDTHLRPAVWAGLCEVLERDALAIAWQGRLPFVPLDPAGTGVERLLARELRGLGADIRLFDVPTDGPLPVVLAVGWDARRPPHAAVGAACRASREDAAVKALYEVAQMTAHSRDKVPAAPERIRTFDDHAALYATARWADILRRALGEREPRRLGEPGKAARTSLEPDADSLPRAVDALAKLGLEVVVVELTTPDVAEAGLRVVRVMVPGAVDINGDLRFPRLGGRRLYEVPVRLGLSHLPLEEAALRRIPIPLA